MEKIINIDSLLNTDYLNKILNGINGSIFKDVLLNKDIFFTIGKVKSIEDKQHKGRIRIQDIFLHSDNVPVDVLPFAEPLLDENNFIVPAKDDYVFLLAYKIEKFLMYSYFYFGIIRKEDGNWKDNYDEDIPKIDTLFKKDDPDSHLVRINNNRKDKFIEFHIKDSDNKYTQDFTIDIKNKKIINSVFSNQNKLNFEMDMTNVKSTFELKDSSNSIKIIKDSKNNKISVNIFSPSDSSAIKFTNSKTTFDCGKISSVSNIEVCGITPISGNTVSSVVRSDKLNAYFKYLINTQLNSIWKMTFNMHLHIGYIGNFGAPVIPIPNVQPQLQNLPVPSNLETVGFFAN